MLINLSRNSILQMSEFYYFNDLDTFENKPEAKNQNNKRLQQSILGRE